MIEGMNITALVSIGTAVVPAVPTDAIVTYQGQDYIFVLTNEVPEHHEEEKEEVDNSADSHQEVPALNFERVLVIKGVSDIGYTEVTLLKNLPPKTQIIVKGAFFALAKMTNAGGHEH